jgi:hypothetical protein
MINTSLEDIRNITRVTGIKPMRIHFYTATGWKWKVYLKALKLATENLLDVGSLIRECFKDDELKIRSKDVPSFVRSIIEDVKRTPSETAKRRIEMAVINETKLFQNATNFLSDEFNCEIVISSESDPWISDPEKRAKRAQPYRPAIFIEKQT